MLRILKAPLLLSVGIILSFSGHAAVTNCQNEWIHPSSQTMILDSTISFALSDFKNGERHFSAKQSPEQNVDIYYLKGAVVVKGYSQAQLVQFSENTLFMMPMTFAVPTAIMAQAAPKGPCSVKTKAQFSLLLSGPIRVQDRMLTRVTGQLSLTAPSELSYELDASIDPPAPNKVSIRYSGTMSFAPKQESVPDDLDITGYIVVTRSRPFPIAGSAGVPTKVGDLRRYLASERSSSNTLEIMPDKDGMLP